MGSEMKRVWLCVGVGVALLTLLGATSLALAIRRAHRQSDWPELLADVRLLPERPLLAAADVTTNNAFYFLRETTNCAVKWDYEEWARFQTNRWDSGSYTGLEQALAVAAPCLELLARAATLASGQVETVSSFAQRIPYVASFQKLAKLQAYRMGCAFAQGRPEQALAILDQTLSNTAHLERGAPLVTRLTSMAADLTLLAEVHRALVHGQLPDAALRPTADRLARRRAEIDAWAEALRYERLCSVDMITLVYTGNLAALDEMRDDNAAEAGARRQVRAMAMPYLGLLGSSAAVTRRHFDAVFSHIIARADEPWRTKEFEEHNPIMKRPDLGRAKFLLNDPLGRILMAITMPTLSASAYRQAEHHAALETVRVALLAEAWRKEHGQPPERLEQLVPGFLNEVPRDPCVADGRLIYRRTNDGFCVYSVGANGKDDGGDVTPAKPGYSRAPDMGWRVAGR